MVSQPNMASRSVGGLSPKVWGQKSKLFYHFSRDFRIQHCISRPQQNVASINQNTSVNLQCVPYNLAYFPWPLTQKRLKSICSLWPTLWKFSIFRHCQASHTKAPKPRPTKFCQMIEGFRGLLYTVKILGKFVPIFCFLRHRQKTAMGSQPNEPNLASRSEVVAIYKLNASQKFWGHPPKIWGQKHKNLDHFSHEFRTGQRISPERNKAWTNRTASVNL